MAQTQLAQKYFDLLQEAQRRIFELENAMAARHQIMTGGSDSEDGSSGTNGKSNPNQTDSTSTSTCTCTAQVCVEKNQQIESLMREVDELTGELDDARAELAGYVSPERKAYVSFHIPLPVVCEIYGFSL